MTLDVLFALLAAFALVGLAAPVVIETLRRLTRWLGHRYDK